MATSSTPVNAGAALEPMSMGEVLRIAPMRRLWYAQIVSTFGDMVALYAVIAVMTFKLGANPQQLTGVQISFMLPIAVLGVIAGVFVDRWPLKPTMVASDMTRALLVLLLLLATRIGRFYPYYAVLALISVVSSFFQPAQGVALRSLVPLHGLRSANALMQQVMMGMRIIGPFVAAMLVAAFGATSCYWADAASFVASGCLIASIALRVEPKAAPVGSIAAEEAKGLRKIGLDMKQGFDFIFHHAGLLFVILALSSGMFVLGCFGPLIAVYVRDSLHASTKTFGFASSAIGFGMLCGINGLTVFAKKVKNTLLVYAGLSGIAAGLVLLTLETHVWTTIVGDLIIGVSVAGIIIPAQTLIQQETPHALMGRVGSTVMSFIFGAQICGLVLSGILAERIGVRHVFAVCAGLLGVLIGVGRVWMEPRENVA
jgi:DHA3 family macrolide efflux protein-like MFS transporter